MKKSLFSVAILLPIVGYSVYKILKAKKNLRYLDGEMYLGIVKYSGKLETAVLTPKDGKLNTFMNCENLETFMVDCENLEITFILDNIIISEVTDISITRNNSKGRFDVIILGYDKKNNLRVQSGWMSEGQV